MRATRARTPYSAPMGSKGRQSPGAGGWEPSSTTGAAGAAPLALGAKAFGCGCSGFWQLPAWFLKAQRG
jgi:hypothetical protein